MIKNIELNEEEMMFLNSAIQTELEALTAREKFLMKQRNSTAGRIADIVQTDIIKMKKLQERFN